VLVLGTAQRRRLVVKNNTRFLILVCGPSQQLSAVMALGLVIQTAVSRHSAPQAAERRRASHPSSLAPCQTLPRCLPCCEQCHSSAPQSQALYPCCCGCCHRRCVWWSQASEPVVNAWKSVPLGRFSAATSFELGPISRDLTPIDFSAGFSEKSARVFGQLLCSCFADKKTSNFLAPR
jgi:hypothetical protein